MTVFLIFLRCSEILVSMYRSKLDYILMPEKDESTNAMSHYTNGKIRGIYSSRVRSNHTIVPGDNLVMRDGKYEHFVEKFNEYGSAN